ncbi:hypothetical protein Acor_75370 [Acrocarpospora corrugata]|uniref:Uncharacterized protein n=1 Tax=Acrocarpospora corrugata TaxID=35763 RepID=A0A5M3WAR8_9ACTN|nr:hypothetical protein [Acrocarpospora corrugata]GES05469.1 hypothetical protein Acor_75370 [Acrocarpospora corrugata]
MVDDDPSELAPASPAETLRLIDAERAEVQRGLTPDPRLIYVPWGLAWLVGHALMFLRFGPDGRVLVAMPVALPLIVLYVLLVIALVVSARAGIRAGRHVVGVSSVQSLRYGLAWVAAFGAVAAIAGRYSGMLPPAEVGMLWAALSVAVVGVLYIAGAAIWQAQDMFRLGAWITLVNIVGVLAGPGWHSLAISLAGGGGLLVGGFVAWRRWRRPSP